MQKAAGASIQSDVRDGGHHSIISELVSLIEHVQASMLEATLARETALGHQEAAANVVVLDDVTPRYVKASDALHTCNAGLGAALRFLLDARPSNHGACGFAGSDRLPNRANRPQLKGTG
ncbi:hypothetical protein KMZ29_02305 [Bradyrhizobium sediminis]|uniref:Uncharacterized protein n=1 Tax=Bradyrhizobium sediminis TaxID=2840469 RepID=A0A975NG98_9BRAD|nr:hypothetical protein [Bradyrhizobium sediminis]QWG13594.1 hypothetical protein KMZ29_02305 [Bradyrhizobium sediminis]